MAGFARGLPPLLLTILALWLLAAGFPRAQQAGGVRPLVLVADLKGAIGPAAQRFVERAVEQAEARNAHALVLRIDTPGGLVTSMRGIISAILAAKIPVIGYVAPPGARAASAGTYIMYATHVAAMAPGTNIGAATPIQIGGLPGSPPPQPEKPAKPNGKNGKKTASSSPENPETAKAVNDAVAFIRSLAELRGRNVAWAEKAVREAASVSASQAVALKVVDLEAPDLPALLQRLDGRSVEVNGMKETLHTANATVEQITPSAMTRILSVLTNPNIAFILMLIGTYGLIFEFLNPGTVAPGVIGLISLILALYSLNQLPIDYAGLILIIAGIAFMIAEAFAPSFGILGFGGFAAFVMGSALLFDTDIPYFRLSWSVIAVAAIASGLLLVLGLGATFRSQRRPAATGMLHMRGAIGEVLDWSGNQGHVWIEGERWRAQSEARLSKGDAVRVEKVEGLSLIVAPVRGGDRFLPRA
jgi:membrane-bound serine protease (ClpP class)